MQAPKPFSIEPMLCYRAERPPEGREWCYELKLDGFRAICRKSGRSAQLWLRNQKDFTRRFAGVAKGIAELDNDTVIDGESSRWTKTASRPSTFYKDSATLLR